LQKYKEKIKIELQKLANESSNENKIEGYRYAAPECAKYIQKLNEMITSLRDHQQKE
jgi:hypothetical protein